MSDPTPYLLELWQVAPERLVLNFVIPPGGQLCWSPDPQRPWTRPPGWPVGYEWRLSDQTGEVQRSPVWVEPGEMVAGYRAPRAGTSANDGGSDAAAWKP